MTDNEKKMKKVLLVDDDQFLLNMYAMKFQKSNYDIETVGNAELALEKLRSGSKYHAIIFDVVMPGTDGFQFAEIVKKEKLAGDSALIALTNQAQSDDIERGKSIGLDGYVVKANSLPSEVVQEVGNILNAKLKNQNVK